MGSKLPNHRFSIKQDRTVSRTQSLLNNAVARLHRKNSTHKKTVSGFRPVSFLIRGGKEIANPFHCQMPPNGMVAKATKSDPRDAGDQIDHIYATKDSLQRLLAIVNILADPVYRRDLLQLEGVMGPELDKETHMDNLTKAMLVASQIKDEEITKLKKENETLMKNHETFQKSKKEFENEKKDFEKNRRETEAGYKKKESQLEKDFKRRELKLREELKEELGAVKKNSERLVEDSKKAADRKVENTVQELLSKCGDLEAQLVRLTSGYEIEIERYEALEKRHREKLRTQDLRLQVVDPYCAMSRKPSTY